jgi:hypothetical protein
MREDFLFFVSLNGRFECSPVTASSKGSEGNELYELEHRMSRLAVSMHYLGQLD